MAYLLCLRGSMFTVHHETCLEHKDHPSYEEWFGPFPSLNIANGAMQDIIEAR